MSHQITLQPSGHQFKADDQTSLLQAALDAELLVPYGCRDGACGSCKARVIEGEFDHGRAPLSTLTEADRDKGLALLCCAQARSDMQIECRDVRRSGDIPLRKLPCRVTALHLAAGDVMVINLKLPANDVFRYLAGQYIDFLLADGRRRSFSIANAPGADSIELHIRKVDGGFFTEHVFGKMKERDILRFEGPLGGFFLRESARPVVFLAGGTGFAPVKAIVEDMRARGIKRPVTLYWGSRDSHGLYMAGLAHQWSREIPDFRYVPVISGEPPADWSGRTGLVHQAVMADLPDMSGVEVYACGAPAMIEAARSDFARCGLPEDAFFADAFTFAMDALP
ncbi:CDP-6-deoxy-delta-3,4-glucoseen reductase [Uliginosibacterium sp. H1]|uniref:CDP-6-deoxy-delta-3,4-glucoseen reductase n=1 Tax=Uliginosibacterium sp. H1 TaxID=3114757 RepID=UPI002E17F390|nr:CDP-6-deoxy-delta-3,4-glucoseen reductase [Uliginosibacterium sp. H1]